MRQRSERINEFVPFRFRAVKRQLTDFITDSGADASAPRPYCNKEQSAVWLWLLASDKFCGFGASQFIATLVVTIAGVSFDPLEIDMPRTYQRVQFLPQFAVFYRLTR